jgi:hypothetical protein
MWFELLGSWVAGVACRFVVCGLGAGVRWAATERVTGETSKLISQVYIRRVSVTIPPRRMCSSPRALFCVRED